MFTLKKCLPLLIMIIFLITPFATAQDGGYRESFDNPTLPDWELLPNAIVTNGVLQLSKDGAAVYQPPVADFLLAFNIRFVADAGEVILTYRSVENEAYEIVINPAYAVLGFTGSAELDGTGFPLINDWFEVEVNVQADSHVVSINNELMLSATDTTRLTGGQIGLRSIGEGVVAEIDEFNLVALGGELTPSTSNPDSTANDAGLNIGTPAYEASQWQPLGGPPGGLGYDIRMRPDNPDEMYVTDARAGIFKSVDGGLHWYASNNNLIFGPDAVAPIFCATIDPHDYDVVWIGTQITGHLYRSVDAGETWEARDNGIVHDGRSLRGITIDANDVNIVYVGLEIEAGMYQRENPEATPDAVGGEVYKSTDNGLNWTRIWQGQNVARYVWIDPRNSNRVYVSTGIFDRTPANAHQAENDPGGVGILRSDDGGQTWTILDEQNGLGGRIIPSLFMHPTNPDILLAAVYGAGSQGGVYVTYDGGDTWKQSLDYPAGMHNVEIAPSDPDIWYAATENAVFRSDDAGQNWQAYPLATSDRLAGMPIDLQVDPRDSYRIFVNNYGGSNFVSTDGGVTWQDASQGYTGATAEVFLMPDDSLVAIANTAEFRSEDGGVTWLGLHRIEESALPIDPAKHVVLAVGGNILHSVDGGKTWYAIEVVNPQAEAEAGNIMGDVVSSRLAVAPSDPQIIYFSFRDGLCGIAINNCFRGMPGFFRSTDGGYTWQKIPDVPFADVATQQIVVHPEASQKLYVATGEGLYLSTDGGDHWEAVTSLTNAASQVALNDPGSEVQQLNTAIISAMIFDPFDPNILYVAVLEKGLFRSEDGGQNWQIAAYGMDPNEPILALVADPNRPGVLYAGSKWSGVFVSLDYAQTWKRISEGFTNTSVMNLALTKDGSILYAGTFSSGVWRLGGE